MYTHDLSCALPVGIESSREISAIGYDAQVRLPQVASLSQHTFYAVLSIHAMIQFLLLLISLDFCVLYLYAVQKQFRYILCGVIHEQQNHFIKRGTSQPDDETKSNTISSTAVRE